MITKQFCTIFFALFFLIVYQIADFVYLCSYIISLVFSSVNVYYFRHLSLSLLTALFVRLSDCFNLTVNIFASVCFCAPYCNCIFSSQYPVVFSYFAFLKYFFTNLLKEMHIKRKSVNGYIQSCYIY